MQSAKDRTNEILGAGGEPDVAPTGSLDELLDGAEERDYVCVPVDRGRLFERAKSEIELSAEASAEAEAVLAVAVGLAIPGWRSA